MRYPMNLYTILHKELSDPTYLQDGCLAPRATLVPALHRDVYFRNKEESEMFHSLNGTYRFSWQRSDCLRDFFTPAYDDSGWDTLEVPSMWQYHGYSKPQYPNVQYPIPFNPPYISCENPVGYYRRIFNARKAPHSILYFGGVDNAYFVYLNGEYVGFSKGSRLPAEYDVTELLRDGENLLCVKVFTYSDATYLENQDMLLASGIFRDVILVQTPEVSVWDYEIHTEENTLSIDVTLWDGDYSGYTLRAETDSRIQELTADKHMHFSLTIPNAKRWNAETPHLYPVYLTLLRNGETVEVHSKKVGFVKTTIAGNRLLVNGAPITIKGICRHEHDPQNGRAITVGQIEQELRLIKEYNLNAIRCAHYPNHPAFYEIASELGIYVMNEGDLETHGCEVVGDQGYLSKQDRWLAAYMNRTVRMVERDKNETCVIIWSAGNEHGRGENIDKCLAWVKKRLDSIPVFHTIDDARNPPVCDFRMNGYFTMASLTSYPPEGKPVILTEYGHAMGNSPGLMEDTWDYVYRNRHIIGGYLWEFKNHGFYQEDENGIPFYQYGGDFGDLNHWSNFNMDGYCLSDGTPAPAFRDCKNVLSPCYIYMENGKIRLLNTNDFRSLEYVRMHWELCEDFTVLRQGEMQLPAVRPYTEWELPLDTALPARTPGASYFINLRFTDGNGLEIGIKQVYLGTIPAQAYAEAAPDAKIEESDSNVTVTAEHFRVEIREGLLAYYEKDGKVLLDSPMKLHFWRAPTDNDGIVNFSPRLIGQWDSIFLKHFSFWPEVLYTIADKNCIRITVLGKILPTARYAGFTVQLVYRIYKDGLVLVEYAGKPYGEFPDTLPRIGVYLELAEDFDSVRWYGRGADENYCDRKAHCPISLYSMPVEQMNFLYDVPQECGTRTETRFVTVSGQNRALTVIGGEPFSFSCHDFTLAALESARHRNELQKSERKYLYIDYRMRGLGSLSCGPNPEECYELHPHSFRFVFGICDADTPESAMTAARSSFCVHTEALSDTHDFTVTREEAGIIECNINR